MIEPGSLADRRFDVVVYHVNCPDGFGAAWAAHKVLGDGVVYEPGHSGRRPDPERYRGTSVLLLDFCWDAATIEAVLAADADITIVDHHRTAMEAVGHLSLPGLTTYFDMDRSAATMAWTAFHTEPAPALIRHIEDYDLFRRVLPGTDDINLALTSRPFSFDGWDRLDVDDLRREGEAILRWVGAQTARIASSAWRARIGGHDVPIANAPRCFVDRLGHAMSDGEPFAAVFAETSEGVHFSLRSRAGSGIDVNGIAERFGGRGHANAAVFTLPKDSSVVRQILRRGLPVPTQAEGYSP